MKIFYDYDQNISVLNDIQRSRIANYALGLLDDCLGEKDLSNLKDRSYHEFNPTLANVVRYDHGLLVSLDSKIYGWGTLLGYPFCSLRLFTGLKFCYAEVKYTEVEKSERITKMDHMSMGAQFKSDFINNILDKL
jgi:hypothetical protein